MIFNNFIRSAKERISVENDAKQLKMIEDYESRMKQFMSDRDFKLISMKLRTKDKYGQYGGRQSMATTAYTL